MEKHAWYSEKQRKAVGKMDKNNTYIYLNKDGSEVLCTEVTSEKKVYWDDSKYLGIVYKWVRSQSN
jgi:hypothetical protein